MTGVYILWYQSSRHRSKGTNFIPPPENTDPSPILEPVPYCWAPPTSIIIGWSSVGINKGEMSIVCCLTDLNRGLQLTFWINWAPGDQILMFLSYQTMSTSEEIISSKTIDG